MLIADDEEQPRESLGQVFEARGFQVAYAGSIDGSVECLSTKRGFDAVILDMRMPMKSEDKQEVQHDAGLTIARLLKRYRRFRRNVVLVVYTAFPSARDCFACIDAGAYYLPKGVPELAPAHLVEQVTRMVAERRAPKRSAVRSWLEENYPELSRRFGGRTIAILGPDTSVKGIRATSIGGRKVISGRNADELKKRVLNIPGLWQEMPLIVEMWKP